MDYRKLISFGNSSYVISLPKSWITKHKLNKGDLVYLDEKQEGLSIFPSSHEVKEELREINIDVTNKSDSIVKREIIAAYSNNYNTIVLSGDQLTPRAEILREMMHELVALEIMQQTSQRIIAKCFLNMKELSLSDTIRRMDIIIRAMMEDIEKSQGKDIDLVELQRRDTDVNRLFYIAQRLIRAALNDHNIAKQINHTPQQLSYELSNVLDLEHLADELKRIARILNNEELKKGEIDEFMQIFSKTAKAYNNLMKAYHLRNLQLAESVVEDAKPLLFESQDLLKHTGRPGIASLIEKLKGIQNLIRYLARNVMLNLI